MCQEAGFRVLCRVCLPQCPPEGSSQLAAVEDEPAVHLAHLQFIQAHQPEDKRRCCQSLDARVLAFMVLQALLWRLSPKISRSP